MSERSELEKAEVEAPAKVAYEDVDDVIAAAARAMDQEASYLSVEELQQVAEELDIPARLVQPAIEEVRRRREKELAAERAALRARRRAIRIGAGVSAGLGVVLAIWALVQRSSMQEALLAAQSQRSQVVNVIDRQGATHAQWDDASDSAEKRAELSGAENRVRVERKRYDELATAYGREASSLMGKVWVSLGGYPAELPLSSEIDTW